MSTAHDKADTGFSMVEALVALFVFATAAVALMELQSGSIRTLVRVEQVAFAEIVADNLLVEVVAARPAPPAGKETGDVTLGGKSWRWTRSIEPTADPRILRAKVDVGPENQSTTEPVVRKQAFFDADPSR